MIKLSLIGPPMLAASDGAAINSVLAQPKRLALVAYLAAAPPGQGRRRDTVTAMFWPEADAEAARHSLRQSLYLLRRSLGVEAIRAVGDGLSIDPSVLSTDVLQFDTAIAERRWEEALSLYRGAFLEGFFVGDAPEFERWVEARREQLRETAARAATSLAEAAESRKDGAGCIAWALRALDLAPHDERLLRYVMESMAGAGDRLHAIRIYEAFAARLLDEYDLTPSNEIQALARSMRRSGPPVLAPVGDAPPISDGLPAAEAQPSTSDSMPSRSPAGLEVGSVPEVATRRLRRRVVVATAAGVLLLLAVAGSPDLRPGGVLRSEEAASSSSRAVVAALENQTGDSSLDPVGRWAADWITAGLQESELLEVIDPATGFVTARDLARDSLALTGLPYARELARETGAGIVVWGSYRNHADSIYFSVAVTDAPRDTRRRTLAVAGPRGELPALIQQLRSRVAGAVASEIDPRIATLHSKSSPPPSLEAYTEYIQGLEYFVRGQSRDALPHFRRSAELDTTFILPRFWTVFALPYTRAARDSTIRALEPLRDRLAPLDRHSVDYFTAWARRDPDAQLAAVRAAARLAPQSNWTYMEGLLLMQFHRPREALSVLNKVDPERGWAKGWASYWSVRGGAHHALGEYEAELEMARHGRRADPENWRMLLLEIAPLAALGRLSELDSIVDAALSLPARPNSELRSFNVLFKTAVELRAHGHPSEARAYVEKALIELDRMPANLRDTSHRVYRALALYHLERWGEAGAQFLLAGEEQPADWNVPFYLADLAARSGDRGAAEAYVRQIEEIVTRRQDPKSAIVPYSRARVAALLGNRDEAVRLVREAIDQSMENFRMVHEDPALDSLRDMPSFISAVQPRR